MIEIKEINENVEKRQSGAFDDNVRVFTFIDRNDTLGVIYFSVRHPNLAELLKLTVNDNSSLADDLIVDGLVRTACHTFQRENITWIVAEEETINENKILPVFFSPLITIRESVPHEILTEIFKHHSKGQVMKTDMIYKGCCKGD